MDVGPGGGHRGTIAPLGMPLPSTLRAVACSGGSRGCAPLRGWPTLADSCLRPGGCAARSSGVLGPVVALLTAVLLLVRPRRPVTVVFLSTLLAVGDVGGAVSSTGRCVVLLAGAGDTR
jgi:hypothetical protein